VLDAVQMVFGDEAAVAQHQLKMQSALAELLRDAGRALGAAGLLVGAEGEIEVAPGRKALAPQGVAGFEQGDDRRLAVDGAAAADHAVAPRAGKRLLRPARAGRYDIEMAAEQRRPAVALFGGAPAQHQAAAVRLGAAHLLQQAGIALPDPGVQAVYALPVAGDRGDGDRLRQTLGRAGGQMLVRPAGLVGRGTAVEVAPREHRAHKRPEQAAADHQEQQQRHQPAEAGVEIAEKDLDAGPEILPSVHRQFSLPQTVRACAMSRPIWARSSSPEPNGRSARRYFRKLTLTVCP